MTPHDNELQRQAHTLSTPPQLGNFEIDVQSVLPQQYEILQVLGKGGMGVVYKAMHKFMNRVVAIKMLHANARYMSKTFSSTIAPTAMQKG